MCSYTTCDFVGAFLVLVKVTVAFLTLTLAFFLVFLELSLAYFGLIKNSVTEPSEFSTFLAGSPKTGSALTSLGFGGVISMIGFSKLV